MLIDTGASACFIRKQWAEKHQLPIIQRQKEVKVTLANNSQVITREEIKVEKLSIGGATSKCTLLVLEHLPNEVIIGVDWLRSAGVHIQFGKDTLWCGQPIKEVKRNGQKKQVLLSAAQVTAKHQSQLKEILKRYEFVFSLELPAKSNEQLENAVHFEITLIDPKQRAIKQRERRLSPAKAKAAMEWVREEVKAGRMERSSSDWSSPLVIVPKHKDGEVVGYRVCGDYRALNEVTKADAEPLPLPEEIFDHLNGAELFSKIDLLKGFYQIPVDKKSQPYLAVSTPDGLYHHTVMPFGVKNAPGAFQREMRRIFRDRLMKGVLVYIDDVIIYSKTADEHLELIEWVLQQLRAAGYYAHPDKCEFMKSEVSFLGHVLSGNGIAVQQHKVKAVMEWPTPTKVSEVRSFLGLTGYYRRFIKDYSKIAVPLTDLTRTDIRWQWKEKEEAAFQLLKRMLCSAEVLAHADPKRQFIVQTDASDFAAGAVLSQKQSDGITERPIAYWSYKFNRHERLYHPTQKELLAIKLAVEHWSHYLEGHALPILIRTDHQPLTWLNNKPALSGLLARWMMTLSAFKFKIDYVKGKNNQVADALSRRADIEAEAKAEGIEDVSGKLSLSVADIGEESIEMEEEEDRKGELIINIESLIEKLRKAAKRDKEYSRLLKGREEDDGLVRKDGLLYSKDGEKHTVWIPNDRRLRTRLLQLAHDWSGHFGIQRTLQKLRRHCKWKGMWKEVEDYCHSCVACAANKSSNSKPGGMLHPLPIPTHAWESIGIDFIGPLPTTSQGNDMIMIIIDRYSNLVLLVACKTTITGKKAGIEAMKVLLPHAGIPKSIVSDRDVRFTGEFWGQFWEKMGTKLDMSTAYHPQSNGQTERTNRTIQALLRIHLSQRKGEWDEWLPIVAAAYNSTIHETTGKTPFELSKNHPSAIDPLQWALSRVDDRRREGMNEEASQMWKEYQSIWAETRKRMEQQREKQKKYANERRRPVEYKAGDRVMLSTKNMKTKAGKLSDKWVGPYLVKEVKSDGVNVVLELPPQLGRIHNVFHVSLVKPVIESKYEWPDRAQPDMISPVLVDGQVEWEVEEILDKVIELTKSEKEEEIEVQPTAGGRTLRKRKRIKRVPIVETRVMYLVKWKGYPESEATWKEASKLSNCQELIDEYERRQAQKEEKKREEDVKLAYAYVMQGHHRGKPSHRTGRPGIRVSLLEIRHEKDVDHENSKTEFAPSNLKTTQLISQFTHSEPSPRYPSTSHTLGTQPKSPRHNASNRPHSKVSSN